MKAKISLIFSGFIDRFRQFWYNIYEKELTIAVISILSKAICLFTENYDERFTKFVF